MNSKISGISVNKEAFPDLILLGSITDFYCLLDMYEKPNWVFWHCDLSVGSDGLAHEEFKQLLRASRLWGH